MFRRHRLSDISTIKSKKKFLSDKDSSHRIKHLRILIDHLPIDELQSLFLNNSSFIFLTFSDTYFSYESDVKQKANSGFAKDIDTALLVFEKILLLLPDLIHRRWQFNCIFEIIGELLNIKNAFNIRKQALRLFLIWYQILGGNATISCHRLFSHLVPEFGALITEYQKREESTFSRCSTPAAKDISPQYDPSNIGDVHVNFRNLYSVTSREPTYFPAWVIGDDEAVEDETLALLRYMLRYLVTESSKVEWMEMRHEQHLLQLWFLFEQLKHSYLPVLFPCLCPLYSIYIPLDSLPKSTQHNTSSVIENYPIPPPRLLMYQEEFVCWLSTFVYAGSAPANIRFMSSDSGLSSTSNSHGVTGDNFGGNSTNLVMSNYNEVPLHLDDSLVSHRSHSPGVGKPNVFSDPEVIGRPFNTDVTSVHESTVESLHNTVNPRMKEFLASSREHAAKQAQMGFIMSKFTVFESNMYYSTTVLNMVREVLYGCRQNINLIQEILHQGLLLPIQRHKALYAVITVYDSWLEFKNQRPIFLQSPDSSLNKPNQKLIFLHSKFSVSSNNQRGTDDELEEVHLQCNDSSNHIPSNNSNHLPLSDFTRSANTNNCLYPSTINDTNWHSEELRGCLQNTIQVMLQNMTNVFYATCSVGTATMDCMKHQVDLCRLILQIFRFTTKTNELSTQTWLKLLSVLMDIMRRTMIKTSLTDVQDYKWLSNDKLTQNLFQTLNGALLRATLFASIGQEPWDQCLEVYSQLTHWPALIIEWRKVMDMLTTFLAKLVYGVDLAELPQEKKGRRGKQLAANSSLRKARPKSYTEAAFGQNAMNNNNNSVTHPPVPYPSALSIMSGNTNHLDGNSPVKSSEFDQGDLVNLAHSIHSKKTISNNKSGNKLLSSSSNDENWTIGDINDAQQKCDYLHTVSNHHNNEDALSTVPDDSVGVILNDTLVDDLTCNTGTLVRKQSLTNVLHSSNKSDIFESKDKTLVPVRRVASELSFGLQQTNTQSPTGLFMSPQPHNRSTSICACLRPAPTCNSVDRPELNKRGRQNHHFNCTSAAAGVQGGDEDSLSLSHNELSPSSFISNEDHPDGGGLAFQFNSSHNPEEDVFCKPDDNLSPVSQRTDIDFQKRGDTLTNPTVQNSPNNKKSQLMLTNSQTFNLYDLPRCILAGGSAIGWTYEAVIICWRRFMGLLGNFNNTCNPSTLIDVYNYLNEMIGILIKISQHQLLPQVTDSCVQPLPPFVPPIDHIASVLFETWELSEKYSDAKILAIRILCNILLKCPYRSHNLELIGQFYHLMHRIITTGEEKYILELIRSCNVRLFLTQLPSSHLLILDMVNAAKLVLNTKVTISDAPRTEALHVIINLLCYPNHFGLFEMIDPNSVEPKLITCNDLKSQLINVLMHTTLTNPVIEVRCVSVVGLVDYLVIELMASKRKSLILQTTSSSEQFTVSQPTTDSYLFDVFVILFAMMRMYDQSVGLTTVEMILILADYCHIIYLENTKLPYFVILCLTWTLQAVWESINLDKLSIITQRYFTTVLHAIIEWTMYIPFNDLQLPIIEPEPNEQPVSLLNFLMHVLCSIAGCGSSSSAEYWTDTSSTGGGSNSGSSGYTNANRMENFPDPLKDLLNLCKQPIDMNFFPLSHQESNRMSNHSNSVRTTSECDAVECIRLVARVTISHLLNQVDQFPMTNQGAQLGASIQEHHDTYDLITDLSDELDRDLNLDICKQNNMQMFVIDRSLLLTFLTLPRVSSVSSNLKAAMRNNTGINDSDDKIKKLEESNPMYTSINLNAINKPSNDDDSGGGGAGDFISDQCYTRIIIRDATGKYCWDASRLYGLLGLLNERNLHSIDSIVNKFVSPPCPPPRSNPNPPPLSHDVDNIDLNPPDSLNDLLCELATSSPECSVVWGPTSAGEIGSPNVNESDKVPCVNLEKMTVDQIFAQRQLDEEILQNNSIVDPSLASCDSPALKHSVQNSLDNAKSANTSHNSTNMNGTVCVNLKDPEDISRHLLSQLGYLSWRTRPVIELLDISTGLIRELKHLDKLGFRETHKIAVFYVGAGQEDKQTILSNQAASLEFENFLAGIGWEIDLLTHQGYRGGLERSGRIGTSTPYYVTSTIEVVFHVSTRMPSSTQEDLKYKHLGNDEVMIIWNENSRSFRRSVLRTQFGDVLIIITPLLNGLYSVEVRRESQVGFFGPIVDSAILSADILPGLVRATAINASRAIRVAKTDCHHHHYKDRVTCLQQIVTKYILPTSFEDFAQSILSPGLPLGCGSPTFSQLSATENSTEQPVQNTSKEHKPFLLHTQPMPSLYNPQMVPSAPRNTNVTRVS